MDFKALRSRGLSNVRSNWKLSIGTAAMAWFLAGIMTSFIPNLNISYTKDITESVRHWLADMEYSIALSPTSRVTITPTSTVNILHFILGGVIELGYCIFLLKQHDQKNPQFNDLFSMFDYFGTGFAQRFLRMLYVTLWTLLLIIPGIVAHYSYAMTPYILAENPQLTANQAISRSQTMMDGHKMDLFMLHLSFIGWDLLAALTFNIGYLWLNPYKKAAEAAFYRELNNRHPYL